MDARTQVYHLKDCPVTYCWHFSTTSRTGDTPRVCTLRCQRCKDSGRCTRTRGSRALLLPVPETFPSPNKTILFPSVEKIHTTVFLLRLFPRCYSSLRVIVVRVSTRRIRCLLPVGRQRGRGRDVKSIQFRELEWFLI